MRSGKVWTVFWCLLLLVIMAPLRVVTAPLEGTKDENFYWTGANVNLKNAATLRFFFKAPNGVDGPAVKVDGVERELHWAASDEEYYVEVLKMSAGSYGDAHVAVFEKDGEVVGQTLQYSLNTCVSRMDQDAEFGELVKSLYNYGKSAFAYVNAG